MTSKNSTIQQFGERLGSFVFFHLGSDARLLLLETGEGVRVEIEHRRIRPLEFTLDAAELSRVVADPERFEEMMLEHLVNNRRS